MNKSKILKLFLLSIGFIPSVAISAPFVLPYYEQLPSAAIALNKENKPVAFCRLNMDHSLTCFDKQAKAYEVGTLSYPTGLYANWKLKLKKPVSHYFSEIFPQITQFCYYHGTNREVIEGCGMPDPAKNFTGTGFELDTDGSKSELWQLDDTYQDRIKLVGTIPAPVLQKMATYSEEDSSYLRAQGRAFTAATEPGYNIPSSSSSSSSCDSHDFRSSGNVSGANGGTIGGMDSNGNVSGANGGAVGYVGSNGSIGNATGGNVGQINPDGSIGTSYGGYLGRVDAGGNVTLGNKVIGFFDAKSGTVSGTNGGVIGHVPPCNRVLVFEMLSKKLWN